jgi:hypothetical protein
MSTLPDTLQPAPGGDLLAELLDRPVGYAGDDDPPEEEIEYVYVIELIDSELEDEPAPPPKVSAGWFWLGALLGITL